MGNICFSSKEEKKTNDLDDDLNKIQEGEWGYDLVTGKKVKDNYSSCDEGDEDTDSVDSNREEVD